MGARRLRRILPAFPGPTNDAQTPEYERRNEREAAENDRVIPEPHVRRGAAVALHFAAQHALGELRQSRDDVTARIAVTPVLVARSIVRPVSSARMREICRCWLGASESPNQATLETFTRSVACGSCRMISSPKASSQQMFGATSCPPSASGLGFSGPGEKSDSGTASVLTIQLKPQGTNSPKGTRCDLS